MRTFNVHIVVLLQCFLAFLFTAINSQQSSSIASACNSATDCTECMAAHHTCHWCIAKPTENDGEWNARSKRCDTYDNLISKNCGAESIKSIISANSSVTATPVRDATNSGDPAVQVSPQKMKIKLRPNEKFTVDMTFRFAKDYPVDLYYLMDLSQSMLDDKKSVANLGKNLAEEMRNITKDVKLGFGSFVDKVLMPYVNTLAARLQSPCIDCESPYSFKHRLDLSEDTSIFGDKVNSTRISGNLDEPEGGFDALMQAIVCGKEIGWRPNSRKMLIFSTDAPFHSAGDGKLGGVIEPNDGLCHMLNDEYTWGDRQDYPSISQIASKVADNRINVIFAVTSQQVDRYRLLSDIIPGSVTGELAGDSSNVVELVRKNYEKISSKVVMTVRRTDTNRNEDLKIKIRAACGNDGRFADTAECDNLAPGGRVEFKVELQATSCANVKNGSFTETFEVYPTGLTESLTITAEIDCSCACDDTEERSSSCNGEGTYECGICSCGDKSYGDKCQCDVETINTDTTDYDATCRRPSNSTQPQQRCSGRGECLCGTCETCDCLLASDDKATCRRFTGRYCQCNPDNCPRDSRGIICSGQGKCQCDEGTAVHTCQCDEGFTGDDCECQISDETCRDPSDPEVLCNGRAPCKCGICKCEESIGGGSERYTGVFCEECSTCASKCRFYESCVRCYVYDQKSWVDESYDSTYCMENCFNESTTQYRMVSSIPVEQGMKQCTGYTTKHDDCKVVYGYKHYERSGSIVYVKDEKECPFKPNLLAIILGTIGGIVLLGVIALLIWKLFTHLHDRREFAKFEKEKDQAQWNTNKNPIYVQATSTFKNPMYQGSMKKS